MVKGLKGVHCSTTCFIRETAFSTSVEVKVLFSFRYRSRRSPEEV